MFTRNEILQKKMQKIQPEIKKIQTEYKKEPQKQTELLLNIYKDNQINPSFAFLFSFLQIFVIFGLYSAFTVSVRPDFINNLYPFVKQLTSSDISYSFLGIINLANASLILAILASAVQIAQGLITLRYLSDKDPQKNMMKIFTYVFPVIFILNYKHFKSVIFLY
ncbi:MAG: membrane protein insertase YidC [Candidatus Paceibacterota bacterium]